MITNEEAAEVAATVRWGDMCRQINDPATDPHVRVKLQTERASIERLYPSLRREGAEVREARERAEFALLVADTNNDGPATAGHESLATDSAPAIDDDTTGDATEPEPEPNSDDDPGLFRRERRVFTSSQFYAMSSRERDLLLHARMQFTGRNNGWITLTIGDLSQLGFDARSLRKAICGALGAGFLTITRRRSRGRCALYALTWLPIGSEKPRDTWLSIPPRQQPTRKPTVRFTSSVPLAMAA